MSYISFDLQRLHFVHKHPDYRVVSNLDFIANRSVQTSLGPVGLRLCDHLKMPQLEGLFRNTTGKEPGTLDKDLLEAMLGLIAEQLPDTLCDPVEVDAQAEFFERKYPKGIDGLYYVPGGTQPAKCGALPALKLEVDPVELAKSARMAVARAQVARQAATQAATAARAATPAPTARTGGNARNAGTPAPRPKGGVCGLIHNALDEQHKATGEVPTREWVKALALERGWNQSTTGVQYGAWRKQNSLA